MVGGLSCGGSLPYIAQKRSSMEANARRFLLFFSFSAVAFLDFIRVKKHVILLCTTYDKARYYQSTFYLY